jgi:hypothetical protein
MMRLNRLKNVSVNVLLTLTSAILFSADPASAADKTQQGETIMQDVYRRSAARLESSSFGLPLFLDSSEKGHRIHVDVYGIFKYPFNSVANVLKVPANWCDIVALHPNVKACTYGNEPGDGLLTFYIGKKEYQSPEESRPVVYHYRNVVLQKGYLDIILTADEGPFGTRDHTMRFEALPIKGGMTFVHVSYEYSDSLALRLAGKAYFATVGRSKVGFTVTGRDSKDRQVYIGGPRGAVERNAVRYYFAIQSFMTALRYPEKSLLSTRTSQWYDLTSHYRRQLFDLEKKEYLESKITEHKNQVNLQKRIETTLQ